MTQTYESAQGICDDLFASVAVSSWGIHSVFQGPSLPACLGMN